MIRKPMLLAVIAALTACTNGPTVAAAERPNVLFIALDDLNDWIGCLAGHPQTQTPHIDRLARRGMLFTNAHCPSPKCAPSRAAILTGQRPHRTGIYDNDQWWRPNLPEVVTLPAWFKAQGYYVAGAGKVHHHTAGNNPPDQWHDYLAQVFDGPWALTSRLNYPQIPDTPAPPGFPFSGIGSGEFDWGSPPLEEEQYGDVLASEWIAQRLRDPPRRPWFLACGIYRPHMPLYAPQRWFARFPLESIELPAVDGDNTASLPPAARKLIDRQRAFQRGHSAGKWSEVVQAYLATIAFADAQVGRLLDALETSGQQRQTIVVLWSDHGYHLGEKGHFYKQTLWQRSTQVPLIIVAPGVAQAGLRCDRPVNLIDLYPTLLELCALPANEQLDGQSLVPLLRAPESRWERPSIISWLRGNYAIVDDTHHYIRYADGSEELYNRQADPRQWHNLAGQPEHRAAIERLARWLPEQEAPPAPAKKAFDFDPQTYTWQRRP